MRLGAGQQAVEHIDGGVGQNLARGAALAERGDEEGLAASLVSAVAIGARPRP